MTELKHKQIPRKRTDLKKEKFTITDAIIGQSGVNPTKNVLLPHSVFKPMLEKIRQSRRGRYCLDPETISLRKKAVCILGIA